jgi:hypothetical protein
MLDVLIKQSIYLAAILVWRIAEPEQIPNFLQRHVQRAAVPDELKPFDVSVCIEPVVSFGTRGLTQ